MAQRAKYKRDRKPLIFIVCEGRNKTERTYFGHFNTRKAPFNLHIENSEATDIASMAKKPQIYLSKTNWISNWAIRYIAWWI